MSNVELEDRLKLLTKETQGKLNKYSYSSIVNVILDDGQNKSYRVTIFNDLLQEIAKYSQNGAIPLEEQLLISSTLIYKYTKN